jgi:hypothetical protein
MGISGFEFVDGARFQAGAEGDANAVGAHLELLRQQCKGELTPRDVLDDARNPNSPLHSFFEWSDTEAAEQYRLSQARGLIKAVVALYSMPSEPPKKMKMFVHIPEKGAPHYRETSHAMSQAKTREMVLMRAWNEFMQWKKRYQDLAEFAKLFAVADEVHKSLPRPKKGNG